jgi:hypothetical protein
MSNMQFFVILGIMVISTISIIMSVVIYARMIVEKLHDESKYIYGELAGVEGGIQKWTLNLSKDTNKKIEALIKSNEKVADIKKSVDLIKKDLGYAKRFHVYWGHDLGGSVHYEGVYDTKREAEEKARELTDSMFSGWVEEKEEKITK